MSGAGHFGQRDIAVQVGLGVCNRPLHRLASSHRHPDIARLARQFRASQSERLKKVSGMIIEVFGLRPPASAEVDHVPRQCRNCEDNAVARQLFHEVGAEQNRAACHRVSDRHSHLGARRDPCRVGRRQQPTTAGNFQTDRAFDAIHQIVAFKAECFRRAGLEFLVEAECGKVVLRHVSRSGAHIGDRCNRRRGHDGFQALGKASECFALAICVKCLH